MPKRGNPKCQRCSKLSLEQALQLHGPEGDGCWTGTPLHTALDASGELDETCHKRRNWYKKRELYNRNRRLKYKEDKEPPSQLTEIPTPSIPAVILHFYRERKDSELHALGSELWLGQQKPAPLSPVHTLGWSEGKVKAYILEMIDQYARHHQLQISGIAGTVEIHPSSCPLNPCPLKAHLDSE